MGIKILHLYRDMNSPNSLCGRGVMKRGLTTASARAWKAPEEVRSGARLCKVCFKAMMAEDLREAHATIKRYKG